MIIERSVHVIMIKGKKKSYPRPTKAFRTVNGQGCLVRSFSPPLTEIGWDRFFRTIGHKNILILKIKPIQKRLVLLSSSLVRLVQAHNNYGFSSLEILNLLRGTMIDDSDS